MMLCRLLEDLDCTLVQGRSDIEVNAICCDSRSVTPGCVFVCLPGQHTDGRHFAHAAAAAGAAVLVFEGTLPNFEFSRSCSPALVQAEPGKARRVLALMASRLYGYPARRMTMIGITGTKGKTTTAHLLAAVLTASGRRVGCIGTNGAVWPGQRHTLGYTTPESCDLQHILRDMADDGCDACVMEVSSLGLKMDRVGGIAFDVGVFTNLSPDHIGPGEHASYAEYRAWKSVLFRRCKVGVVNADDRETPAILEGHSCRVVRYGIAAPADWLALPGFTPRRTISPCGCPAGGWRISPCRCPGRSAYRTHWQPLRRRACWTCRWRLCRPGCEAQWYGAGARWFPAPRPLRWCLTTPTTPRRQKAC